MGHQQLLLITLGIIVAITGLSIGISIFTTTYDQQILDMALIRFHDIGMQANKYRMTPADIGGGNGTYIGFQTPGGFQSDELAWVYRLWPNENYIDIYLITNSKTYSGRPYYIWGRYIPESLQWINIYNPENRRWNKIYDIKSDG